MHDLDGGMMVGGIWMGMYVCMRWMDTSGIRVMKRLPRLNIYAGCRFIG
jgi:hypothetical protein